MVRARVLSLPFGNLPNLEYIFLAIDSITISLARGRVAMPSVAKALRTTKKDKVSPRAAVPTFSGQKKATKAKYKPSNEKYCSGCDSSTHLTAICWTLTLELRPANIKKLDRKGNKGTTCKPFTSFLDLPPKKEKQS